jgi:hypothetical protein
MHKLQSLFLIAFDPGLGVITTSQPYDPYVLLRAIFILSFGGLTLDRLLQRHL